MASYEYMTKEGYENLQIELKDLQTRGRREAAAAIAEAREKGDLSENAEYDAAKEAQGHLEAKIAKLEELMGKARILDESQVDTSKVGVLSKVKIKNTKTSKEVTWTLVSEKEANVKEGKISVSSPIGKGLIGKKVGEVAEISIPAGQLELEILDIGV